MRARRCVGSGQAGTLEIALNVKHDEYVLDIDCVVDKCATL